MLDVGASIAIALKWAYEFCGLDLSIDDGKGFMAWAKRKSAWNDAARKYHQRLINDYGKLRIIGKTQRQPIDELFTAVNVLEKVAAFEWYEHEQLKVAFQKRRGSLMHTTETRRDGLEVVSEGRNLFILGKPGAGKTTFMKRVAIDAAAGKLKRRIDDVWVSELPDQARADLYGGIPYEKLDKDIYIEMVPVFIGLKQHSDSGRTLEASIAKEFKACKFPDAPAYVERLLHSGRLLVLLDGLDEVTAEGDARNKLADEIEQLMREYRESQFLLTCRVAAAEFTFDRVEIGYLEMADFDDDQIKTYVTNWFGTEPELADECWQALNSDEYQGLRELAQQPLLLSMLCLVYEESDEFPLRLVEVYEDAVDALLRRWDSDRRIRRYKPYKVLSRKRKQQMFARMAADLFKSGELIVKRRRLGEQIEKYMQELPEAPDDLDGEKVLMTVAAQHGIFVERAKGQFSFAHLTFQEYFTAKYIVDNNKYELLWPHVDDAQWRVVFELVASMLDEADAYFEQFAEALCEMVRFSWPIQAWLVYAEKLGIKPLFATIVKKKVAQRQFFLYQQLLSSQSNYNSGFRYLIWNCARNLNFEVSIDLNLELNFILDYKLRLAPLPSSNLTGVLNRELDVAIQYLQELSAYFVPIRIHIDELNAVRTIWSNSPADALKKIRSIRQQIQAITGLSVLYEQFETYKDSLPHDIEMQDVTLLKHYLRGNQRFVANLKLATVTDRDRLEDLLLRSMGAN